MDANSSGTRLGSSTAARSASSPKGPLTHNTVDNSVCGKFRGWVGGVVGGELSWYFGGVNWVNIMRSCVRAFSCGRVIEVPIVFTLGPMPFPTSWKEVFLLVNRISLFERVVLFVLRGIKCCWGKGGWR